MALARRTRPSRRPLWLALTWVASEPRHSSLAYALVLTCSRCVLRGQCSPAPHRFGRDLWCSSCTWQAKAADIVREAVKQLGAKAKKLGTAKVSMWKMLRELALVLGPRLAPFVAPIIPQAQVRGCSTARAAYREVC